MEEVYIDGEEIAEFLFKRLVALGYAPNADELFDLSDIVFDFLIHKGIVEELEEEE